jgi:hypothetical protein
MSARAMLWVVVAVLWVAVVHLVYGQPPEGGPRQAPCGIGWLYSSRTPCDD